MIFFKWVGVIVGTVLSVYLAMWLGGGWGELLVSTSLIRVKVLLVFLFGASAVLALIGASEAEYHYESFDGWFFVGVMWVISAFVFGAITDPLVTYGLWPWQWLTWWTVLLLPFTISASFHLCLAFRDDLGFRDMFESEGLWR